MVAQAPPTHDLIIRPVPYAGVATRAVALAMDAVVIQGALLIVAGVAGLAVQLVGGVHLGSTGKALVAVGWGIATASYFVVFWSVGGQTPGMRAMHVLVTKVDGGALSLGRSIVRVMWLGLCIIPFFLGFLPVLFNERRRGLHDLVAGTVVRYAEPADAV